jgi:hypothetical protein
VKNATTKPVRCAIYTRVSTDHGLEQDFNSLDAQHDAAQAYIRSQAHAGWTLIRSRYDDGGYSGGSTDRPALQRLLSDVKGGKIDVIVVYKVDRLTLSLPEIKSGRIDGAIRPGSAGRECGQRPEHRAKPARPCSAISACEPRCNIFDTI